MKFGVREICDVTFKATADNTVVGNATFSKGQPVLYIDTAKTSSLESAATTVYAQGGKGNSRLLAWEGEKTMTFKVDDALLSPIGLSVLSGAGLIDKGATTQVHHTATVTGNTGGTMTVAYGDLGLVVGEVAQISQNTNALVYGTVVDSAGAAIRSLGALTIQETTNKGKVAAPTTAGGSDDVKATYKVATGAGAPTAPAATDLVRLDFYLDKTTVTTMTIDAGKFAGYYYVEASTLFRDQATGKDLAAEIIIPLVKIQSNFTFAMASTGDPSTFSFTMDAFPGATRFDPTKKVLCTIQVVE